jgi:ribonuclease P protein component
MSSSRAFRPHERIRRRPDFQQVHERGIRLSGRFMTAVFLPNNLPNDRLGIIASRRLGDAVQRNRAKRLIREIFRLNKRSRAAGTDIVIIPRGDLVKAPFPALEADYRGLLHRHGQRARS